jgi:SAM-dependent methyltransferase
MNRSSETTQWTRRVEAHHEQSARAQQESGWDEQDQWQPLVGYFKADPYRKDDPILAKLLSMIATRDTVLDVGGGAGRYALPLALKCRQVAVVEPSAAMLRGLNEESQRIGLANIAPVAGYWADVGVEPADVVLCANVIYDVAGIVPFVEKLTAHANRQVLVLAYDDAPANGLAPFWKPVYGDQRVALPGAPEFLRVLREMGIHPDVEIFDPTPPESAPNIQAALCLIRNLLFVRPGTELDQKLQRSLHGLLEETPTGVTIKESRPRSLALISWQTGGD